MGYLIDANVLSELRKPKRAEQVAAWFRAVPPSELFTSVLVMAELRRGSQLVRRRDPASADRLDGWIARLWSAFEDRVLPVSSEVANRWADLMVPDPIPVVDGLLAATALVEPGAGAEDPGRCSWGEAAAGAGACHPRDPTPGGPSASWRCPRESRRPRPPASHALRGRLSWSGAPSRNARSRKWPQRGPRLRLHRELGPPWGHFTFPRKETPR